MTEDGSSVRVFHEASKACFTVSADPDPAVLEYALKDGTMVIHRTFVPETLRGMGIAGILTKAALEYARAEDLKVVPACSYVDVYMKRHKEWADLRA